MSNKKPNKHLNKTNIPYCTLLYPKYNQDYNLYKRFILMTGECKTRQATQEELDRYKHLIK
jgi:hypothetical protein